MSRLSITAGKHWAIRVAIAGDGNHHRGMGSFVSVYVDWAATVEHVRAAATSLPMPAGVLGVDVVEAGDTFGCRIAVDLTGDFDEQRDGPDIARSYAAQLSEALAVPAFALHDLILVGRSDW